MEPLGRILIVEPDPVAADAVWRQCTPLRRASVLRSAREAFEILETKPRLCALISEQSLVDGPSVGMLRRFRGEYPLLPMLLLTAECTPQVINRAQLLRAEFVAKPARRRNVRAFLRRAVAFERVTDHRVALVVEARVQKHSLSPRETDILAAAIAGTRRNTIADQIGTTENTIKSVVKSLLRKCESASLAELVRSILVEALAGSESRAGRRRSRVLAAASALHHPTADGGRSRAAELTEPCLAKMIETNAETARRRGTSSRFSERRAPHRRARSASRARPDPPFPVPRAPCCMRYAARGGGVSKADLVAVVEAAYRLDDDGDAWLADIVGTARPVLDRGHGVYAFEFDASEPSKLGIGRFASSLGSTVSPRLVARWHTLLDHQAIWRIYRGPRRSVATIGERLERKGDDDVSVANDAIMAMCRKVGVADQLTVRATDPSHHGLAMCSPLRAPSDVGRFDQALWQRIATHVVAGYRLRRALSAHGEDELAAHALRTSDAVLDPDGHCRYAQGDARARTNREKLRRLARAIDRARSRDRSDPEEALRLWEGLCAGTWSLVECFDTDGRRLVVARRNAPDSADPRGLSPRERQVASLAALGQRNKEIAYWLGLSISTVGAYLRSAMQKLGLRSRAALVQHFRGSPDTSGLDA